MKLVSRFTGFRLLLLVISGSLLSASSVPAGELTALADLLPDHEMTWQTELPKEPSIALAGTDYFGVFMLDKEKDEWNVYRHYDRSGNLLWSTQGLGYNPRLIYISRSGNRVMVKHEIEAPENSEEDPSFVTEVYDETGKHLFSCPRRDQEFHSSPTGMYFYSISTGHYETALHVLDSKGQIVPVEKKYLYWDVKPLDDYLLVCINKSGISIIDVARNEIVAESPLEPITGRSRGGYHMDCSPGGERIAIWNDHEIYVVDKNLNPVNSFVRKGYLHSVEFSDKADIFCFVEFFTRSLTGQAPKKIVNIMSLDGSVIGEAEIELPPEEKSAGGEGTWVELSFRDEILIYRFFSFYRSGSRNQYMGRSLLIDLDPDFRGVATEGLVGSRLYPIGNSNDFIEVVGRNIKLWLTEGGKR